MSEEERKAWARLVLETELRTDEFHCGRDIRLAKSAAESEEDAKQALRDLGVDVDSYLAPEPEQCGQCGAEIQGHHGYCEIAADDDSPPSGE